MRQDWTPRGSSRSPSPEHSDNTGLYQKNSGNKIQLWPGESRKVKEQDLETFLFLRALRTLKTIFCFYTIAICGGEIVKNLTLINKTLSRCERKMKIHETFQKTNLYQIFKNAHPFSLAIPSLDMKKRENLKITSRNRIQV